MSSTSSLNYILLIYDLFLPALYLSKSSSNKNVKGFDLTNCKLLTISLTNFSLVSKFSTRLTRS
jgi:hypothetical protein